MYIHIIESIKIVDIYYLRKIIEKSGFYNCWYTDVLIAG